MNAALPAAVVSALRGRCSPVAEPQTARKSLKQGLKRPQRPASRPLRAPESLHPALWLGHQLGVSGEQAVLSGFARLDAQLPGGGWPRRALTELLLPHAGVGEIRLLAPSLVAAQQAGRLVMVFDPPAQLSAPALGALGLDVAQLLLIHTRTRVIPGTDSLWALEQALRSGHVGAILAWLPPRLAPERLRRLQLAAHAHNGPAFVLRELAAQQRPTAAPLRLLLRPGGADRMTLQVLKRRGPPQEHPLVLPLPPVLSGPAGRRARNTLLPPKAADSGLGVTGQLPMARPEGANGSPLHAGAEPSSRAAVAADTPLPVATFIHLA